MMVRPISSSFSTSAVTAALQLGQRWAPSANFSEHLLQTTDEEFATI
jgi:hypothetical protein